MSVETLKPQLMGWMAYREIGAGGNRWATGVEVGAPEWVAADVFIDGSGDIYSYGDAVIEELESLLKKHGVWYELSYQSLSRRCL